MATAFSNLSTKATPQRQRTPGRTDEVRNSEGGYVFEVSDLDRLRRFLVIGVEGGTYYATERSHLEDSLRFLTGVIAKDEQMVLAEAVRISDEGLAYSNSPAIFAVAAVLSFGEDKAAARAAVPKVCRTATHLYEFAQYIDNLSGWGKSKRGAVSDVLHGWGTDKLALQAVKYRSRSV